MGTDDPSGTPARVPCDSDPSLPAPDADDPRWAARTEYATLALDWLFDHDFLGRGARAAVVGLVSEGNSLRLLGAVGDLPPVPRRAPIALPLDGDAPLCRAARLGVCTCMPSRESIGQRAPWLAAFATSALAAITVPIRAEGRPFGAIGVTYGRELFRDGREILARTTDIGDSLGAALRTSILLVQPWEWLDWTSRAS